MWRDSPARQASVIMRQHAPAIAECTVDRMYAAQRTAPSDENGRQKDAIDQFLIAAAGGRIPFNVSPFLWQQVGADGTAADARSAVKLTEQLVA